MARDILVVDDEADIRAAITGILEDEGYATRGAADSAAALAEIDRSRPDLLVLDIWLQNSELDGMELLVEVKKSYPNLPVVMISGHGTIEMAVTAIQRGAYDFIEKPFKADRLLLIVTRAIEAAKLIIENEELRLRAEPHADIVGTSPWVQQIRQAIAKVSPTGSRVLITGPAGSGKEVVARQLHGASHRHNGPFVVINCATMTPERLEPELFGVAPGIEGPNAPGRVGTFERAHGGTLFLDEVSDMPLETQGKIVRVLQDLTFERVGGDRRVSVDVRVIASTNRDLSELMNRRAFREDLYYRLNVVPISVPSLRDRREDIPDLAQFFMQRGAERSGLAPRVLSQDAIAALRGYDWPGNVRELRNVVDWILIMAPGTVSDPVLAAHLPPDIGVHTPGGVGREGDAEIMALPLRDAREVFERQYLEAQVVRFSGNISRTASFVGMERSALHRKLRSLGVSSGDRN
jgi:two-component system nitrogen regulation response regulator NtrX